MDSFGKLNFIINLASIYKPIPHEKIKEKDWDENINIHLKGGFLLGQIFQNILVKNHGRMIHFSDWVADSGRPTYKNYLSYYVSKKGIIGLTEAQALEMAPHVLVNAIAPGPILPPLAASKKVKFEVQKQTPLKKWGGVVEIVKTVLFLLKTDFITGECIRVDGGRHLI
jgi:pteridine reductase